MAASLRGLLRRIGYRGSRHPVILRYHRVADLESDPHGLAVAPGFFAEHLEVLRGRYHPLALRALVGALRSGSLPPHAVVLTFDDGYADNLDVARPQLERQDIPATVFITTGYVDGGPEFLGSQEILRLADDGLVEIGAHTITHPRLVQLAPTRQWEEIAHGKAFLEKIIGGPVVSFAYPYGQSAHTISMVKQAGFESACATVADVVVRGSNPYRLPRLYVGNWDGDQFARFLASWIQPRG